MLRYLEICGKTDGGINSCRQGAVALSLITFISRRQKLEREKLMYVP